MAGLTWAALDMLIHGRATLLGVITGAVAGLVAITPASGSVNAAGALGIGCGASLVSFLAVSLLKPRLGYDDSLDVFGVHGLAGAWGALAAGLWATAATPGNAVNGLFYGNPGQVLIQLKAVLYTAVWCAAASWIILKALDAAVGLRASEHEERVGLDLSEHSETAYTLVD